jgi:hypothetical protein
MIRSFKETKALAFCAVVGVATPILVKAAEIMSAAVAILSPF